MFYSQPNVPGESKMKQSMILFLFCAGLALNVSAQQIGNDAPASREDVERYMQVAHASDMNKQIMQAMSNSVHDMIHQQALNQPNLPPDFEAHMEGIIDDMLKNLPVDDMLQAMVPIYQKHFTHGDIETLTAFYSTSTGQKMLHELPAITGELMQAMMPIMQSQMQTMQQRIKQEVAQSLKNGKK